MEWGTLANWATALVAVAALVLSIINTVRARTPRPHWEVAWDGGGEHWMMTNDGTRCVIANQGRGEAHDVTFQLRADGGSWRTVDHSPKMELGSVRTISVAHDGTHQVMYISVGNEPKQRRENAHNAYSQVSVRVRWRQAPRTHKVREKVWDYVVPRE